MRAAMGFVFGRAGMKPKQVPNNLKEKLTPYLDDIRIMNKDLESALAAYDQKFDKLTRKEESKDGLKEIKRTLAQEMLLRRNLQN